MLKKTLLLLAFGLTLFVLFAPALGLPTSDPAQAVFWGWTVMAMTSICWALASTLNSRPKAPAKQWPPKLDVEKTYEQKEQELYDEFRLKMLKQRLGV